MNSNWFDFPDWQAPATDSSILIWPPPAALLAQTRDNARALAAAAMPIAGIPLNQLRQEQRRWLDIDPQAVVVATGHQTELFHAGVWAKLALIHAAVERLDGVGFHFAVDSDEPKHLTVRWPGGSLPITDDARLSSARWCGLLDAPTPGYLQKIEAEVAAASAGWPFKPMIGEFFAAVGNQPSAMLSSAINTAMHDLDHSLGLRHRAIVTSPLWTATPYLAFVYNILSRAAEFAAVYNRGLDGYRQAHHVHTAARPMPNLLVDADRCEVPFWLDDLPAGQRWRAQALADGPSRWKLKIADDELSLDPQLDGYAAAARLADFLRAHHARLSPRALTLTTFLRLLVVDQFVHGIGGGRYDQVSDFVMANFFQVPPPKFSVTTSTLYFPTALGRTRPCLPCLEHQGHQIRHRLLDQRKMQLVEEIESLPRKSPARRRVFMQIHRDLTAAAAGHPRLLDWQRRVEEANNEMAEVNPLFDREYFYAIQPRTRLEAIIAKYQDAMKE